jgi:phospholipid/cholesterol/gamma-HCH transport system ATP-binding protein
MSEELIKFSDVTIGYDDTVIQQNLNFTVGRGTVFVIMGPSGCGKSTVLRAMCGLLDVMSGSVLWFGRNFNESSEKERLELRSRFGMLFQKGALWSSMTLSENVELPLRYYTDLSSAERRDTAEERLGRVGLLDAKDKFPSEISGGMQKRAGLARAMALDPEVLLLDEPSAGLDPISSRRLDDLIIRLRTEMGKTFIVVTHELPSIFAIADDSIFLDNEEKTALAMGRPADLLRDSKIDKLQSFLRREGGDD